MNEQIKELMGKTLDDNFSHTWNTMTYDGLLQFSEKFAELIVQECVQICEQGTATQTTSSGAASMIKQHFGVKE